MTMSKRNHAARPVSPAARVFSALQADDVVLPGETSALRKSGALFLMLMVLVSAPLFWAANAAGLIGDVPAAVAHGGNSGPGGDDDGQSSAGDDDDDDDDSVTPKTDDTSANGHSTRGTTNDADTHTRVGTDDTSANGHSTHGTTNDNDTRTAGQTGTNTGTNGS
jgi:hypothetical protein